MNKTPVSVNMPELKEILERYIRAGGNLNYAVKIVGHPGIGKSDAVRQVALENNLHFMDTRLAFKENVDLGGYPVPDHEAGRMIYYRPRFIPPETVPEGRDGILWFLDEANRAHPTVIQTLFQIITERVCGEHRLPRNTFIVLAGNLGDEDRTQLTEFDDAALEGRLAVFHLMPDARSWLLWADAEGIHPTVKRTIAGFPERLWDEAGIHPNPRGWHQVSLALKLSYGLTTHEDLCRYLAENSKGSLLKTLSALIGRAAASEFLMNVAAPRELTSHEVLSGDLQKLAAVKEGRVPAEDVLWALSGALVRLREIRINESPLGEPGLDALASTLRFLGVLRADMRISFFHDMIARCALFTQIPKALQRIPDTAAAAELRDIFTRFLEEE